MSIDWITVAAQIANFLVLVWLLKRFLYRPILNGIDAREAEITERMQAAVEARKAAQAAEAAFRAQSEDLAEQQEDLTETIRNAAESQRDKLLSQAHERIEKERDAWDAQRLEDARKYTAKLHRAGAEALLNLTRKALSDLADETFEAQTARHLAHRLHTLWEDLAKAAGESRTATLTSHLPLSPDARAEFQAQFADVFPHVALRFDHDSTQAPGMVLRLGGAELAWTLESYIEDLEALVAETLASGVETRVQHEP